MTLNVTIDCLRKSNVASASAYDSVFLDCEESGLNKNNIMWRVSQRRICICSALIVCAPSLRATNHMMPARRHASCDIKVPNTKDTFFFIKFTYQIYLFIGPFRGGCTAKVQTWPAENSGCHDKLESGKAKCLWKSCQREVRAQLPNSQKDASWWQGAHCELLLILYICGEAVEWHHASHTPSEQMQNEEIYRYTANKKTPHSTTIDTEQKQSLHIAVAVCNFR